MYIEQQLFYYVYRITNRLSDEWPLITKHCSDMTLTFASIYVFYIKISNTEKYWQYKKTRAIFPSIYQSCKNVILIIWTNAINFTIVMHKIMYLRFRYFYFNVSVLTWRAKSLKKTYWMIFKQITRI